MRLSCIYLRAKQLHGEIDSEAEFLSTEKSLPVLPAKLFQMDD